MEPITIGLIGIAVLIVIFLLGLPVGFAMALVGFVGFCLVVTPSAALSLLPREFFETFSSYSLSVIPMFVFMGSIAFVSGMSGRLFNAAYILFGRMRGGLAMASIAATAGFSAICGSTSATAAAMGKVAIPEMNRYGYNRGFAAGCIAAAGGLGILIPPSTIFIIYGILVQESIGKLFISGVVPGILLALVFIGTVFIMCRINPNLGPAGGETTWRQKIMGLTGVIEMLIIFGLVLGGLFAGIFSPTQAGAAGATAAIIIGLVRRQLPFSAFWAAIKDTLQITAMIMIVVGGAMVFGKFMAVSQIPMFISNFIGELPISPMGVMGLIILMYILAGCFMDSLALIMLTIPILFPLVTKMGFDPIWFGVIIVMVTNIGVITPPVGINVFVIKGVVPDVPIASIFKGTLPFLAGMILVTALILIFPQIATWLPSFASY
ncbi:MAG TPA: TRAP transporter large permease [Dehalococcoidales bacterium]|nr:TRAP transporter large permease [Dehalococcoidales bacterium]